MGLSYDLISEFVKITNDKKEGVKEGTVYATVVNSTEGKYVKIDGSDLLTPIDTTTGIDDGERVTVMIKDHKATVTGNITSPSVGTNKFDSLVGTIVDANLGGINADIENLIAKNAYLENVFAQNSTLIDSKIENLVAKDSYLENTYAENSTIIDSKIENLEATDSRIENSVIENFQVIDGVVQNLKATTADIKILNADFAQIKTLVNGNLTSDNILSFVLTSEKVTVDDAFIKDAMIDTVNAAKINAGRINTSSVSIGSEDGGMIITGSTQQFMDKNGNVRIQIGKDASGDFTFVLYGEDGTGQLINQNGITASAIGDGLIVNDMVSDNAAISGGKLDISSVITEINSDNSTTIKSSKIYLNDQAQSLEVAFNSLKTKVDTIQEVTIQGDLTAIVEQVQSNTSKIEANRDSISTLISENTVVKKQVTDLQGTVSKTESTLTSKYTSLNQNLEGFKTTVADTYATKSSVTDVVDNIEANYSTTSVMNSAIEQKAQEISASVSSTYATKNQVSTLDNTLKKDYSTTKQMESAINVAKEEINLGVSSIYETKEDTTSKINNAVNTAKQEAIKSANSTLTSTISNYYTKKQTDSQINVAKEAINLGVSTTYETKENVQTKVTSTLNSAKSYADTKKKEAISTAATDATSKANTAKQEAISSANNTLNSTISNYYTKSQTDSQIKVAKEAINLSVSNTYETKANVESKINSIQVGSRNWIQYSSFPSTIRGWSGVNGTVWKINTSEKFRGNNTIYANRRGLTTDGWSEVLSNKIDVKQGDKVVGSWYIKYRDCDQQSIVAIWGYKSDGTGRRDIGSSVGLLGTNANWTRYVLKGTVPADVAYVRLAISHKRNGIIYAAIPQLEFGDTATDWNPAPEDISNNISTAKSEAIASASSDATSKVNAAKTELNTAINKKANSSDVYTKSEVYTKKQTDSQINVAKEAINLSVSNTYETKTNVETKISGINIGGRNYLYNSDFSNGLKYWTIHDVTNSTGTNKSIGVSNGGDWMDPNIKTLQIKATNTTGRYGVASRIMNLNANTKYTISGFYASHRTKVQINVRDVDNANANIHTVNYDAHYGGNSLSKYKRFETTFTTTANTKYLLNLYSLGAGDSAYAWFTQIKLEKGNKATDWSPAPEDIDNNIDTAKSEAISTAASDATSKANTAKNDAIKSANSTLTSTISKYYTKKQTDSQINVAKEAINLSVSNTYETKTNVTSKITAIESETKSLKQTVSSLALGADSISASVKSLEESMVNTTNGLANDISKMQEQVNLAMTSSDVKLEIQKELKNGVKKVSTSTGFTFDDGGLKINKSDSEMNTQITEDGMKIYKNSEVMLTANNQGVDAKNLHATTYLIIGGNSRMEDFTENGSKRTAVFWIG